MQNKCKYYKYSEDRLNSASEAVEENYLPFQF